MQKDLLRGGRRKKMKKKSVDKGAESSVVIPFLRGAKSIDDKVAFLRSAQGNSSLSDYDRNLVGRALERYTTPASQDGTPNYQGPKKLGDRDFEHENIGDFFRMDTYPIVNNNLRKAVNNFMSLAIKAYRTGDMKRCVDYISKADGVLSRHETLGD